MKILRFNNLKIECSTHPRAGLLLAHDTIADLKVGYARYLIVKRKDTWGREMGALSVAPSVFSMTAIGKPEIATLRIEPTIVGLITIGKPALAAMEPTAAYLAQLLASDPHARGPLGEPLFMPLADCKVHAPVRPSKVIAFRTAVRSDLPPLWIKANNTISSPFRDIVMPRGIDQLQCETKLAVVMGKRGNNISEEKAYDWVFGYMLGNDVSVRNDPGRDMFNSFLPSGPWVVTKDEVKDPLDLAIRVRLNDKPARESSTKDMPMSIPQLIAYTSTIMQLEPGDILLTGAPRNDPDSVALPLKLGDVLDAEIEGVAKLRNKVGNDSSK